MTNQSLLVIDESIATTTDGTIYIVGSAVAIAPATRSVATHAAQQAVTSGSPQRTRPFHWVNEGTTIRQAMIEAIASTPGIDASAVTLECATPADHEAARLECLSALLQSFTTTEIDIDLVLFESREKSPTNQGQNRTDHRAMTQARHARIVEPTVRYEWVNKTEPLCWLADAVAGATNMNRCGDHTYTQLLPSLTIIEL